MRAFEKIPTPPPPFRTPTRRRQVYEKEDKLGELEARLSQVEEERDKLKKMLEEERKKVTRLTEQFEEISKRLFDAESALVEIARELRRKGYRI